MSEQQPKARLAAALILTAAAEHLDAEPDTVLTETAWYETFNHAAFKATGGMRPAEADLAIDIAWHAIPPNPTGATHTEWQAQLRRVVEAI